MAGPPPRTGPGGSLTRQDRAGHASVIDRFDGLAGRTVFLYVMRGTIAMGGRAAPQWPVAELTAGDTVEWSSGAGALVLFGHGAPLGAPVVAHGPFAMNTREQIVEAINDCQAGRFGPGL